MASLEDSLYIECLIVKFEMIFHHKVELLDVDTQNLAAWNFFECMSNQIENDFY